MVVSDLEIVDGRQAEEVEGKKSLVALVRVGSCLDYADWVCSSARAVDSGLGERMCQDHHSAAENMAGERVLQHHQSSNLTTTFPGNSRPTTSIAAGEYLPPWSGGYPTGPALHCCGLY